MPTSSRHSTQAAERIALAHYGLSAKATAFHGEVDATFRLQSTDGQAYCLKISQAPADLIDLQLALAERLASADLPMAVPRPIAAQSGERQLLLPDGTLACLSTWLPGRCYAEVKPHCPRLLASLGQGLGAMSRALQGFSHPAAQRELRWDISALPWVQQHLASFPQAERELAEQCYARYEQEALPRLPQLRRSIIHNDANDYNLLVQRDEQAEPGSWHYRFAGLIDFGDAVHTHTINELAVALAYAMMGQPDPAGAAVEVIRAYHAEYPLTETEIAALPALIGARLLISLTVSHLNQAEAPERAYLQVSRAPALALLRQLQAIPYALLHAQCRYACGWPPCPQAPAFHRWLEEAKPEFAPVVPPPQRWRALDLSVGSLELGHNLNFEDALRFEQHIERLLQAEGPAFGVGGYGEPRPFYTTDAYQVEGNEGPRWRTVHLGLDIWAEAGTPVYAPLAAWVHSFADNAQERDYGPAIILAHEPVPGLRFYTLYGHLSRESLEGLEVGMPIAKGQRIATFGSRAVNGGWPPHLHFQVLLDTLGKQGDFPGVGFPEEWPVWRSLCPDPELLLPQGMASRLPATKGRSASASLSESSLLLAKRRKHIGPNLSLSYRQPLHIVRGAGHYLYDGSARRYLDTVNNVPHVGHQHPKVVEAVQRQSALLNTNTRYLHGELIGYAEALLAHLPPALEVLYFVTSGSEANELALRLARTATGRSDVIAMEAGYHGHTSACIDISAYKFKGEGGQGQPRGTYLLPLFTEGEQPLARAQAQLQQWAGQGVAPAAFISESILSCGGQLVPPAGYFQGIFAAVRSLGGLCILDEVQTGFGRVGERFWGFELQGVVPDVLVMGKPMGNGFPIGAVACTRAVAEAFDNGMEFFSTFGGNPVACAAGRAVLGVIEEEGLQARALETGNYLKARLSALQTETQWIAEVRGHGLFLGVELSRDGQPATRQASYLINAMRARGILMSTDGPDHNVLKIKPPMSFGRRAADVLADELERVLGYL